MNNFDESKVNRNRGKFANKTSGECALENDNPTTSAAKPKRKTIKRNTWDEKGIVVILTKDTTSSYYNGEDGRERYEVALADGTKLGTISSHQRTDNIASAGSRIRINGKTRVVWSAQKVGEHTFGYGVTGQTAAIRQLLGC